MVRLALFASLALASVGAAFAGPPPAVPALGSPIPVAVALGAVALGLRLFRRR
jgi:hypothetical protein